MDLEKIISITMDAVRYDIEPGSFKTEPLEVGTFSTRGFVCKFNGTTLRGQLMAIQMYNLEE